MKRMPVSTEQRGGALPFLGCECTRAASEDAIQQLAVQETGAGSAILTSSSAARTASAPRVARNAAPPSN